MSPSRCQKQAESSNTEAYTSLITAVLRSRAVDDHESLLLARGQHLPHLFSTRGHELAQAMVALQIRNKDDAAFTYYRSKAVWFTVGMPVPDYAHSAIQSGRSYAGGNNVSVLPYRRNVQGPTITPVFGGVGSQFEPALGWARALTYDRHSEGVAFAFGGDGSVSTGGFWSAIRESATHRLPLCIVIENNGYALSTESTCQVPNGRVAQHLASFAGIRVLQYDGSDPACFHQIEEKITEMREHRQPILLELLVPRLDGHAAPDKQLYRQDKIGADPVSMLRDFVVSQDIIESDAYEKVDASVRREVIKAFSDAGSLKYSLNQVVRGPDTISREPSTDRAPFDHAFGINRVSVGHAIRLWLTHVMTEDASVVLMGQDIGQLGGVHGVTAGMQSRFGPQRVIDSSLNESALLGQALGMALKGLRPVVEIQYRKYIEPGWEQLSNIGLCHWLSQGTMEAPIIVRIPIGVSQYNDPWHSETDASSLLHKLGLHVACPATAQCAIELFSAAYESGIPTIILEHRSLYFSATARSILLEVGTSAECPTARTSRKVRQGDSLTIISWGAMVHLADKACEELEGVDVDLIDLRWLRPWDQQTVLESVRRSGKCLILEEDRRFLGLGAEIAATLAEQSIVGHSTQVIRLGAAESPVPVAEDLVRKVLPQKHDVVLAAQRLLRSPPQLHEGDYLNAGSPKNTTE